MIDRRSLLNDPEEALYLALDNRQSSMWTVLPGIVQKVNFAEMTVEVQPAIQGSITLEDGSTNYVNLPLLVDVPIVFPSAGGFTITFPLTAGDEVLVLFASRCIDGWWQSGGINIPIEARMHDLSDGFALPGPKSVPKVIPNISTTAMQIRNDAGTSVIEIGADGKVKITASEFDLTGNLKVTGTIMATGEITSGIIPLTAHLHSGVTSGGSNTGPAVP